jgi:hypothetical protein
VQPAAVLMRNAATRLVNAQSAAATPARPGRPETVNFEGLYVGPPRTHCVSPNVVILSGNVIVPLAGKVLATCYAFKVITKARL